MSVDNLSFRKRLGLELFRQYKKEEAKQHILKYLFWECTLRCNLECKHCGSDCHKNSLQKDMPLDDFIRVIDQIRPHVNPHETMIVLTGGEPLMRNDLELCGKKLYEREFPWGFVTNGLGVTEKKINNLLNNGLRAVTVSLDGLENSHNFLRGNKHSFQYACNAIQILSSGSKDLKYDVVSCINKRSFEELAELKKLLINLGVKNWRIFTIFPIGRAVNNDELQLSPKQFKQLFDFISETRKEGKIKLSYGCEGYLGNYEMEVRDQFFFCRAGITVGSILADGSVSACPNLRSNFIQGNIYSNDFMNIWANQYQVFRDRSWAKQGICKDCKHFRFCQGNGMHLRDENGKLLFCHFQKIKDGESSP